MTDVIGGAGPSHSITFDSGMSRGLDLTLGTHGQTTSYGATLTTHVDRGHTDSAALTPSGALDYAHSGSPAAMSFTLTSAPPWRRTAELCLAVDPRCRR